MSEIILCEEWRAVVGHEGAYEVSSFGNVRSVPKAGSRRLGKLLTRLFRSGYPSATLYANGKGRCCHVHQLVLEAFVGPCPTGQECRHFPDRSKMNNRLDNLQWGTRKQNAEDRDAHGQTPRGEAQGNSRLTGKQVAEIRAAYRARQTGLGLQVLGRKYGVHHSTIFQIVTGKTWRKA